MNLSTAAKVGIITILGLACLASIIVWKTEIFLRGKGYELVASFNNVEGLTIGSEVRYRGLKVGKVTRIDPGPFDIKIFSLIESNIKIPADSTLRVAYDGIVGLKFLEIRPGTSTELYVSPHELKGAQTSAIVDFVDLGSKNLQETKAILETFRKMLESTAFQGTFTKTVATLDRVVEQVEKLTERLNEATQGLNNIMGNKKFQEDVKGTIAETNRTLASANRFFDSTAKMNVRTSGGVDVGTRANAVRGDIDIIQNEKTYYRLGFGEGPTRQLGLLDLLYNSRINDNLSYG